MKMFASGNSKVLKCISYNLIFSSSSLWSPLKISYVFKHLDKSIMHLVVVKSNWLGL